MTEVVFEVVESDAGGFEAAARGHNIFTQGETWDELKTMIRDAVAGYFDADRRPDRIRMVYLREEVLSA